MPNITPVWTDSVSVIVAQVLARGAASIEGEIDLTTKHGALLFVRLGRGGANALTDGVDVLIRRRVGSVEHPTAPDYTSQTAAAVATTVGVESVAGQRELQLASVASLVVNDVLCIAAVADGVTRLEWATIAKLTIGSGTGVTLVEPLQYTHPVGDTVRTKADVWAPRWLQGGAVWKVRIGYGNDAAGDSVTVQALAQTYDRDTVV